MANTFAQTDLENYLQSLRTGNRQLNRDYTADERRRMNADPWSFFGGSTWNAPLGTPDPNTGLIGPAMGMMDPRSPMGQAGLRMANLSNPNQIQGAAQNLGLSFGNAITAGSARPQAPQAPAGQGPQQPQQDPITALFKHFTSPEGGEHPEQKAMRLAARAALDNGLIPPDTYSNILKSVHDWPNDYRAGVVSPAVAQAAGWNGKLDPGMYLERDKEGKITQVPVSKKDVKLIPIDDEGHTLAIAFDQSGHPFNAQTGEPYNGPLQGMQTRQIGDIDSRVRGKEIVDQEKLISNARSMHQGIDTIEMSLEKNKIAPGGLAALVADKASDVVGIGKTLISTMRPEDNAAAVDPNNWNSYFKVGSWAQKGVDNQGAQTTMLALAYEMARATGSQRIGMTEIKQQLDMLGDGRADPKAVRNALEAVRKITDQSVENWHATVFQGIRGNRKTDPQDVKAYEKVHQEYVDQYGAKARGGYEVGKVYPFDAPYGPHRFKGGNAADQNNWEAP